VPKPVFCFGHKDQTLFYQVCQHSRRYMNLPNNVLTLKARIFPDELDNEPKISLAATWPFRLKIPVLFQLVVQLANPQKQTLFLKLKFLQT
jgi:hypothetical protein